MSRVKESEKKPHDFLAPKKLRAIRKRATELSIIRFGYDGEKVDRIAEKRSLGDPERKERIKAMYEEYYTGYINREREKVEDIIRKAVFMFELGNDIIPTGDTKIMEYCERRKYLDLAVGHLGCLVQELEYIAETLPCDKNRFETLINDIGEAKTLVKGVRRAANKYIKKKT